MPSVQKVTKQNTEVLERSNSKDTSLTRSNSNVQQQATSGVKTPQEYPEFIKQALVVIEKKVRNLEKRRTKLDEYKDLQKKGQVLNEDQLSAVSKYEEVKICLDLVKDLDKQLVGLAADALKAQKKQAKKEQLEREELVRDRFREVQRLQAILNTLRDERVRQDFLGSNLLTQDELNLLDEFTKLTQTQLSRERENDFNDVADHYLNLVESKNKPVLTTTYTELRKLFDRVLTSTYWNVVQQQEPQQTEQQQQQQNEQENQEQTSEEQTTQHTEQEQKRPSNVNTSTDEYVMITNTEVELNELERQQQHQQDEFAQQDQNTFFTTLNRPDNSIKEFLSENNEGLNFLQDSQIYPQGQEQQQNESGNNENHGFGVKRNDNGFHQQQPRNGGGYNRRPFNNADNNGERRTSGGRGGYNGRGGNRGGYSNRGGNNGNGYRGGYRGKPRNPGQQYNREGGQPQQQQQQQA